MGYFTEYINRRLSIEDLEQERKSQLRKISEIRKRPILTYSSALSKLDAPISISYEDKLPFMDQLSTIEGTEIDIILETPGGSGEIVDDLVRTLRSRFEKVGFIVPGYAKSAGTLMVMAGDEILMGPTSALGPIDAQILHKGKVFSAHAFLEWLKKIRKEVEENKKLDMALIPILQNISPGELESYQNALDFGKGLLREWLPKYKFKFWETHSSTGKMVTEEEKVERAQKIADDLCNHSRWKTHGKPIKMNDLRELRLKIEDYSLNPKLQEAIERYYTLLLFYFERTPAYKLYETTSSQIMKFNTPRVQGPPVQMAKEEIDAAVADIQCPKCNKKIGVQANFKQRIPLQPGLLVFPKDNILKCPHCSNEIDLEKQRLELESDVGKPII
jgi:DNA-directed RNA polymerase subunit RPC12/RpoP